MLILDREGMLTRVTGVHTGYACYEDTTPPPPRPNLLVPWKL